MQSCNFYKEDNCFARNLLDIVES